MLYGSLHSFPSTTWQQWPGTESPFPLVRWWRLSLHLHHSLYCLPLFHYDPLPERNKIMDVIKPPSTKVQKQADLMPISPKPLRRTTHNSLSSNSTSLTLSSHLRNLSIILDSRLFLEHDTKSITTKILFHFKTSPVLSPLYLFPPVKVTHLPRPDWTTATASLPHHPPHTTTRTSSGSKIFLLTHKGLLILICDCPLSSVIHVFIHCSFVFRKALYYFLFWLCPSVDQSIPLNFSSMSDRPLSAYLVTRFCSVDATEKAVKCWFAKS